jgi:thioredoxin-related protein
MKKLGDQKQAEKWGVRAGFMQRQTPQGYGNSSSKRFQRASEGSLSHAVSRARKENKKVLLYVGAEWCPPCKQFKAKVLPRKETREFIADTFIYVQLDGEKGEGPSVAKMIGLRAYPTFAVLDGKGNVLFKQSGAPTTPSGLKNMLSRFI